MVGQLDILIPTVRTIVNLFGKTVSFQTDAGTYNPATGKHTANETAVSAVVTPPEPVRKFDGDTDEQRGEIKVFLPAEDLTFTPDLRMRVVIDTKSYRTVRINPIFTGESVALYEIELEGGD